jgi:HAD superfamily hydrolase (TIGR01549 family)
LTRHLTQDPKPRQGEHAGPGRGAVACWQNARSNRPQLIHSLRPGGSESGKHPQDGSIARNGARLGSIIVQRLALFDLDNTLIDLDAAFLLWAQEFAAEQRLGRKAVDHLVKLDRNGLPHRELFFAKVRERFKLSTSAADLWAAYRRRMPHLVECRPQVIAALTELRALGWRVGIVTNGTADNQFGKIQRTGLVDAVDGYALSGMEGIRKPDTGLFEIAARRCGADLAGGGWMVGDHPVADIRGGHTAGLRTVWIQRGNWVDHERPPDHVVTDVIHAMDILRDTGGDLPERP